jgi:alginate biosynthesis protein Alg44
MTAIVQEAEVQRQHTRYKLPLKVEFNGKIYDAADWSVGGVGIDRIDLDLGAGTIHPLRLSFPFLGFSLQVSVDGEIRYVDRIKRRVGFRFDAITPEQIVLLQFVIDSYLAGDIIDGDDVLGVARRDNTAPARPSSVAAIAPAHPLGRIAQVASRTASYTIILGILAGVAAFVGANVYDRLYIVRPAMATVSGDTMVLSPPVAGQIANAVNRREILAGEQAFTIIDASGQSVPVNSPCDCRVLGASVSNGAFVRAGQTVMTLVNTGSKPYIAAAVDYADLDRISGGAVARIQYLDGTETRVTNIRFQPAALGTGTSSPSERAIVELDPGRVLDPAIIGQPVNVWFDTSGTSFVGDMLAFIGRGLTGSLATATASVRDATGS